MNRKLRNVMIAILVVVAAAAAAYVIYYAVTLDQNENVYEKVQKTVKKDTPEQAESEEKEPVQIPIDFAALREINPEVYAWIQIPGTNVDYPILQRASDDAYYLDHTIDGTQGLPGSIYTEGCNSQDFTDFNTVIYGHDMRDGSMFADLHKYMDNTFLNENNELIIYTPEKKLVYQIFAGVVYDDRHIMKTYDFTVENERSQFVSSLNTLRDMRSCIDSGVDIDVSADRILTLSTCIGSEEHHRFLVEAVLVNEEG